MSNPNNIRKKLFEYVKNPTTWFYWYHNPERLEALYNADTDEKYGGSHIPDEDYKDDNLGFTKKSWRFEKKVIGSGIVIQKDLYDFFEIAVLDETRLKKANAFAEYALYISDIEDIAYFRNTLTRREILAEIDFDRQRDHAAHTVYNYILGWYFFENSGSLWVTFHNYFDKLLGINLKSQPDYYEFYFGYFRYFNFGYFRYFRYGKFCRIGDAEFKHSITLVNEFGDVWSFASLLHDIGYILEGGISSASSEVEHARITNGAKIIHDYFNHYFWKVYDIDFRVTHHIAKFLGVLVPDFKRSESLGSLGDHLCDTGTCENIGKLLSTPIFPDNEKNYALSRNAFSIWNEYYKYVGNQKKSIYPLQDDKKMQDILYVVEKVFKNNIWVGADYGTRNLDHGVCSGLILLQASLFVRDLFLGFKDVNKTYDEFKNAQINSITNIPVPYHMVSEETFDNIRDGVIKEPKRITIRYKNGEFNTDDWFKKVCWATSSAAIHSLVQLPEYKKECKKHLPKDKDQLKIDLNDDPLAFLGILVDTLQEWDRYKVKLRGQSAFTGKELLQSTEVKIKKDPSIITMWYPKENMEELCGNIAKCLEWDNKKPFIVKIKGY
jgi:hypothetical protein